ncbi:amidase [Hylemonella gracilis]|uniref:Aspartyl/glutamyl-tRNA(Asn/Gln) amidotransferase subunit A n=1 Tax=Hylemonella gracilis ATCC 19624 TaxID=887062 RepID=F3KU61_9BURK|nr:amidase [Hylemonella gracilis]EGI76611.1 aspartyl/glutamyl-tRNA(Asn/Gln) amidotransferase subunit A [Hylemonella gracilis ATCC 19624]
MNPVLFNPAFVSIEQAKAAMEAGELTSELLVEHQLQRIERFDAKLHAFVDVYADEAREAARAMDGLRRAGISLGPLHGVTVAVKDLFEIDGKPITSGSVAQPARISTTTATVVQRLRSAGAIVIGKTHTVEYAFGGWGTNEVMGTPWNPWDLRTHRIPGGSSSGSAVAVAAGLACAAIGTDTGGSVRIPAGLCGLVGLKTTHGLISRHGLIELCPSHDTVGPLARTVRDCALLLDVMAGADPRDAVSQGAPVRQIAPDLKALPRGARLWVLPTAERAGVEAAVLATYDEALDVLRGMGMQLVERNLPQSCAESMRIAGQLMSAEGYAQLGPLFERSELRFDPNIRRRILLGSGISAQQYQDLLRSRDRARRDMLNAMDGIDACVFPTNAISAIPVAEVDELATPLSRFGRFVNLMNLCALAVPAGMSPEGMPISIQFIGRSWDEPKVLRLGLGFEQATAWHGLRPVGLD